MTRKYVKGDQPSGRETTWTNTGATRYGRRQHKTGSFGDDMLRPSPNHGTQRLPNDDDDEHQQKMMAKVAILTMMATITKTHDDDKDYDMTTTLMMTTNAIRH